MNLSPDQERAVDSIGRWLRGSASPFYYLAGYAGTGKTTLAQHVAESVDGGVLFAAYTGKAAQAMIQRGVPNATTVHSLIYTPAGSHERVAELTAQLGQPNLPPEVRAVLMEELEHAREREGKPIYVLNQDSKLRWARLLILDECSMIDERIGQDLLSFGTKILVLGDPAQLPPVRGTGFFTDHQPDFLLERIHRQANDNPILRFATSARRGDRIEFQDLGAARKVRKDAFEWAMVRDHEQTLTGKNLSRRRLNRGFRREILQRDEPYPVVGDRIVCLRNNHERGLLNGQLGTVLAMRSEGDGLYIDATIEGRKYEFLPLLRWHFDLYRDANLEPPGRSRLAYEEFDWGFALTVHKSQGSEWDSVLICDDGFGAGETRRRWLYTAITRARSRLTILE